ncbi:MAG: proline--tRNA ligase [Patescibacteria group bacterium]
MTKLIPKTRRDVTDGLSGAHTVLVRAGYIRQVVAGVFVLTHLGWRVWQKLRAIIWEEMERDDVLNIQMPILQPAELWEQTGRWEKYVASGTMFQTRSVDQRFGLAPTAEEIVTWLAATEVSSWRDIGPHGLHFHQIGWKFRNETRPHGGLLRTREFDMSDAYSFDLDEPGMRRSFEMYRQMYWRIFRRAGLRKLISVQADSGAIGGSGSSEFMALSDVGEDVLLTCDECDYGANVERATSRWPLQTYSPDQRARRIEHTPGTKSVEELEMLFAGEGITPRHMVKTIILTCDAETGQSYEVAVCMRGDLQINLVKVRNALGATTVEPAAPSVVVEVTEAEVGFAGPLGLKAVRTVLFDESTRGMTNFLCGLNRTDFHALDVNFGTEGLPQPDRFHDLHTAVEGHRCPSCDGHLRESHGVEVGHIFMLQQGYARSMNATYTDQDGKEQVIWMGCYGIGVTRLLQAVVDQNRDDNGISWPVEVAPFAVHIVPVNGKDPEQIALAEEVYKGLRARDVEVLLDDTDRRGGAKFADADLIGCPFRVTVGRRTGERIVEVRRRSDGQVMEITADEVIAELAQPMTTAQFTELQRLSGQGSFADDKK